MERPSLARNRGERPGHRDYSIEDANGILDPGETRNMTVTLYNDGATSLADVYGELSSANALALIPDSIAFFGSIPAEDRILHNRPLRSGHTRTDSSGMNAEYSLTLFNDSGFEEIETFTIPIGEIGSGDPTHGRIRLHLPGYRRHQLHRSPIYDWIEIDPDLGGSGTSTGLSDTYEEGDEMAFFNLPFPVRFYGVEYEEVESAPTAGSPLENRNRTGNLP